MTDQSENGKQIYFKYRYEITLTNVQEPSELITNESLVFRLNTDKYQIYHYYEWQFFPIWDENYVYLDEESSEKANSSITEMNYKIFIGSEPTTVRINLIPSFWENANTNPDSIFRTMNRIETQYQTYNWSIEYSSSFKTKEEYCKTPNDTGFAIKFLANQVDIFYRVSSNQFLGLLEIISAIAQYAAMSILVIRIFKSMVSKNSQDFDLMKEDRDFNSEVQ